MRLNDAISEFGFEVYAHAEGNPEIAGGYVSDLLSDVIANAGRNFVWITIQVHVNTVAVAALKDLAAIVIAGGHMPSVDTIEAASKKGICLLGTGKTAYEAAGRLYAAGVK